MKNIRFISIILLFFTGLNALAGGYLLIEDPSGSLLYISIEQVESAIFDDFLIPGILLFSFIGLMGVLAAFFAIFQWKGYPELMILQGIVLFVWITLQIFLFEQIYYAQYIVIGIGLVLLVFGIRLRRSLRTGDV